MLSYHILSKFLLGSGNLKHYNGAISRVLIATCQVLPIKKLISDVFETKSQSVAPTIDIRAMKRYGVNSVKT